MHTTLEAFSQFTLAEDYHQKHRLRNTPQLMHEIGQRYRTLDAFMRSRVVTRLNGWVGGYVDAATFDDELAACGLSDRATQSLRQRTARRRR